MPVIQQGSTEIARSITDWPSISPRTISETKRTAWSPFTDGLENMANLQAFERSEYQQVKADLHRKILDRLT